MTAMYPGDQVAELIESLAADYAAGEHVIPGPRKPAGDSPILQVFVPGNPATKGSLSVKCTRDRTHRVLVEEQVKRSKPWREHIVRTIRTQFGRVAMERGPVRVELTFHIERIEGWSSHADPYPVAKTIGDLDKFERNVLDALTDARVIEDDRLVVSMASDKRWAGLTPDGRARPGVQILVWRMP